MPNPYSMVGAELQQPEREALSQGIAGNPSIPRNARGENLRNYLSGGVPPDYEGLVTAYALKHGQDKAKAFRAALPTMGLRDLIAAQFDLQSAGRESDAMYDREAGRAAAQKIISIP